MILVIIIFTHSLKCAFHSKNMLSRKQLKKSKAFVKYVYILRKENRRHLCSTCTFIESNSLAGKISLPKLAKLQNCIPTLSDNISFLLPKSLINDICG